MSPSKYSCLHLHSKAHELRNGLFEITDENQRYWVCKKVLTSQEEDKMFGASEYGVAANFVHNVVDFACAGGEILKISMFNPTPEDVTRFDHWSPQIIHQIEAVDSADLAIKLAHK